MAPPRPTYPVPPRPGQPATPGSAWQSSQKSAPVPNMPNAPKIGHKPPPVPPRPAGLAVSIGKGMIERIDDLSGGGASPIWTVEMKGGAKLVVKYEKTAFTTTAIKRNVDPDTGKTSMARTKGYESATTTSFETKNFDWRAVPVPALNKPAMKAMNEVINRASPGATAELLTPEEIKALAAYPQLPDNLKAYVQAAQMPNAAGMLTKMKFDASFANSSVKDVEGFPTGVMNDKEKASARTFFQDLRGNEPAWRTMGQVVIADYLIGNTDRLCLENGNVTNIGNMIFSRDPKTKKITHAMGYDAFDPSAGLANNLYSTAIGDWIHSSGQYIKDKSKFINMARAVIDYINKQRLIPLKLEPYGKAEGMALANGLAIGWDKQANAIGSKVRAGQKVPSGIMARAVYLGWVK